jgi:hypothetical protein
LAEMMGQVLNMRCAPRSRETWARREMQSFSHVLPHRAPTGMGHPEKRFYANRLSISTSIFDVVTTIKAEAAIGLPCSSEHFRLGPSSHNGENKTTRSSDRDLNTYKA